MTRFDVIGLGMSTIDILTSIPRLPQSNEVFPANQIDVQGGGPVATALVALAKLGAKTAYLGTVAQDAWGTLILDEFNRYGIDISAVVRTAGGSSPVSVILVEPDKGTRAILYDKGGLPELSPSDVDPALIAQGKILHLDGMHLEAAVAAAEVARRSGVLVSFDGGAGVNWHLREPLLPLVDLMVVARQFAHNITGQDDPLEAGPELLKYGARLVVITDGERGAWYWDEAGSFHQPAFPVEARDTTGAGDTFHGAFLYAYLQGWSPQECLRFASGLAALKCTQVGGRLGIPTLAQTLAFISSEQ